MATETTVPTFMGLEPFGDPEQFACSPFVGTAAEADAFLGAAPGTTRYAPCAPPGGAFAISGVLIGVTEADVSAAQAELAALAGECGLALLPDADAHEGWAAWCSCHFAPTDLAWDPGGIVPAPDWPAGTLYQISYALILRRAAGPYR